MHGRFGEQIMADLPKDRVSESLPFTYCGVDIFRPFLVKERQSKLKTYGALFTCLASRPVHTEVVAFRYNGTKEGDCKKRQHSNDQKQQW